MRGKQNSMGVISALLLILCLTFSLPSAAMAAEVEGSLQLDCTIERDEKEVCLAGDEYTLVKIAQAQVDGDSINYQICPDYAEYDCRWTTLNASQLREKAKELETVARQRGDVAATGITDAKGTVLFAHLTPGLYLVMRTGIAKENTGYAADPFLVSVPQIVGGVVSYHVIETPKFSWDIPAEPTEPTEPTPTQPEPSTPQSPTLPQTGQLNWPIPVLGGTGMMLLLAGLYLRFGRRKEAYAE